MPVTIESGRLRHVLEFQTETKIRGKFGETIRNKESNWVTDFKVRGSIEPLRGNELIIADSVNSRLTHRARIRFRTGINTKMRFKNDGKIYHIASILNSELRDKMLEIMCTENV